MDPTDNEWAQEIGSDMKEALQKAFLSTTQGLSAVPSAAAPQCGVRKEGYTLVPASRSSGANT